MKFRRKLFEMDERELRAVLASLIPERKFQHASKSDMQEEIVHWLLSRGMSVRHNFLLYEDDDEEEEENKGEQYTAQKEETKPKQIWLLNKHSEKCDCCVRSIESLANSGRLPLAYSPSSTSSPARQGIVYQTGSPKAGETHGFGTSNSKVLSSTIITNQPKPMDRGKPTIVVSGSEDPKSEKKKECCCRNYCIECGRFCVSILSSI